MNKRSEILRKAENAVNGARQNTYGSPEKSFNRIAALWQAYLHYPINDIDVATMMILFKIARTREGVAHMDNWVDIAGYAACAGEIEHEHLGGEEIVERKDQEEQDKMSAANVIRQVREGEF